jgi:hypothetical protein
MLENLLDFHPIRDHKRKALLAEPMPDEWRGFIEANVAHYAYLSDDEKRRLEDDTRVFVAEKVWEAGGEHDLTDEMKVTVAAQACLLLLGWDDVRRTDLFPNVPTVIVYPTGYHATERGARAGGFVRVEESSARLGEAWSSDLPVVLSWHSAREGGVIPDDAHNVVLHEFAHKLDMIDGAADGVPRLSSGEAYDAWAEVMSQEYAALQHDAEKHHKSFLDHYGATNEAEFFAVATEAFFEKSVRMRNEHPRLYEVMRDYYQQDPAARIEAWQAAQPSAEEMEDDPEETEEIP